MKRLRLPTIARTYGKVGDEASRANLPYERYLLALVEQEVAQREQNVFAMRMKRAGFPVPKSFENFDFSASPGIDKQRMLELAECHWIEKAEVVILVGDRGRTKSLPHPCRRNIVTLGGSKVNARSGSEINACVRG